MKAANCLVWHDRSDFWFILQFSVEVVSENCQCKISYVPSQISQSGVIVIHVDIDA